ncbi:IclR family transcriptional regulator [Polycladospora coralii]|uniref:IclR family transcriptional regulator n=1 Tax=Polycladospora coralii TaxID=2771432 RepID=UPI001CD12AA8|nr:IclR family transcriptional regulator [Polycladospora coralii]
MSDDKKLTVRAAERAMDILLCFVTEQKLGMMEIATRTGLNKSTVFRLLATLEKKGFIKRDPATEKYQLGFRIWELAANIDHSNDPAVLFLPEMERLRDEIDETISLYIRDGNERVRIQAVESMQAIRRVAPIGARMPLSVGASSKILMAYLNEEEIIQQVLNDAAWIQDMKLETYVEQLKQIKARGYAISIEEREEGTAAVSVPVFSRRGRFVAALAVSGPVTRMNKIQMLQFVPILIQSASQMGRMIVEE